MATINIEGHTVTVDDRFLSMSADEQNKAVDEIGASLGLAPTNPGNPRQSSAAFDEAMATASAASRKFGQPSPPPPAHETGGWNNLTGGMNSMIYGLPGGMVDRSRNVINWGVAGANAVQGKDDLTEGMIQDGNIGSTKWISDQFEQAGVNDPGNVVPANATERVLRGVGEGIGATVAPQAALGLLNKVGAVSAPVLSNLEMLLGSSTSLPNMAANTLVGGAAGGGAVAAAETVPEPWKPAAATVGGLGAGGVAALMTGIPGMVRSAGNLTGDFLAPLTAAGRDQMAGRTLRDAATSPGEVIDAIETSPGRFVAGSEPTTFQQAGDMGLGALERSMATKFPAEFNQRRADQNSARVQALENTQPTGAPESVVTAVRSHLADIDQQTQMALDAATERARQSTAVIGQGQTPDLTGDSMRMALETARAKAKMDEQRLWSAVDPDGTLALPAQSTRQQTQRILQETPRSAKPPSAEEAAIYGVVRQYEDVIPFSELTALQSRIKAELRAERLANGESPAYRRLSQMNGAIQQDLETAIAGKVQQQAQAVAAGTMNEEETLAANFQRMVSTWKAERSELAGQISRQNTGSGDAGIGRARTSSVPPAPGSQGQSGNGLRNAARDPRLSPTGLQPNFDRAALDRLTVAQDATSGRIDTFDNKTLGPIRRRPSTTSSYDMPTSAVPAKIFAPGPKSFDAVQKFRNAVGDAQALPVLRDYAIDRIRRVALREDGTFDPNKLATWRMQHSDALRAFPDLDRAIGNAKIASEAMAETAAARAEQIDQAQAGAIGRLLGLSDPQDVTRTIGSIFGRQDAVQQMARLRQAIGSDETALEGLRKGIADFMVSRFVGNTEAGTSGVGTMKSDAFQTFIAQNSDALRVAGFKESDIEVMQAIAADLQRANRSIASVRLPGQSNTAQDLTAIKADDKPSSMLVKVLVATGGGGAAVGMQSGSTGMVLASVATLGTALIQALRQNGINTVDELVRDALLHPDRARMLMMNVRPSEVKNAANYVAQQYRAAAAAILATEDGNE